MISYQYLFSLESFSLKEFLQVDGLSPLDKGRPAGKCNHDLGAKGEHTR